MEASRSGGDFGLPSPGKTVGGEGSSGAGRTVKAAASVFGNLSSTRTPLVTSSSGASLRGRASAAPPELTQKVFAAAGATIIQPRARRVLPDLPPKRKSKQLPTRPATNPSAGERSPSTSSGYASQDSPPPVQDVPLYDTVERDCVNLRSDAPQPPPRSSRPPPLAQPQEGIYQTPVSPSDESPIYEIPDINTMTSPPSAKDQGPLSPGAYSIYSNEGAEFGARSELVERVNNALYSAGLDMALHSKTIRKNDKMEYLAAGFKFESIADKERALGAIAADEQTLKRVIQFLRGDEKYNQKTHLEALNSKTWQQFRATCNKLVQ